MKYEYRVIEIGDLKKGDKIDIPEGSLILGSNTVSQQGYIHDPNKPNWTTIIRILVPAPD